MNWPHLIKAKFVLLHFLFWVAVWFFFVYFFSYNSNNTLYVFWFSSFLLPVTMLTSYFTVYFLIPKYLLAKKYALFALYGSYTLVVSTHLIVLTIFGSFLFLSNLKVTNMPPMSRNFVFVSILVYLVVGFISFVSLLGNNMKTVSEYKELQNKILETQLQLKVQELRYLKKQIHPHFLFNTLNTIYGLSLKQSKSTPEVILKLSNLLDYILYQADKPLVSLEEEISHIKEYIELEKTRFQDSLMVSFVSDEISKIIKLPPMLFMPFVENAFKHGSLVDGLLTIEINIRLSGNKLSFSVKNSAMKGDTGRTVPGIGLENINKRLALHYQDNYCLKTGQEANWFSVDLKIDNINPT